MVFEKGDVNFQIYDLPESRSAPGAGVVSSSRRNMLSPDGRVMMAQRTVFGLVDNGSGQEFNSEHTSCDAISMDTGCVQYSGDAEQCVGSWNEGAWRLQDGSALKIVDLPMTPQKLSAAFKATSVEQRPDILTMYMYMGVGSYLSCYPPEKNVAALNDIGFYLSESGDHRVAIELYKSLLKVAPDRIPLKLNMADSLWATDQKNEARKFYQGYKKAMVATGNQHKVPQRVDEREK